MALSRKVREYQDCTAPTAGNIHMSITNAEGETRSLDPIGIPSIVGDITRVDDPLPDGAYATISAHVGTGCEVMGWRIPGQPMFTTSSSFQHHGTDPSTTYMQ